MVYIKIVLLLVQLVAAVSSTWHYGESPYGFNQGFNYAPYQAPYQAPHGFNQGNYQGLYGSPSMGFQNIVHNHGSPEPLFRGPGHVNSTEPCLNETVPFGLGVGLNKEHISHQNIIVNSELGSQFAGYQYPEYKPYVNYLPPALTSTYRYQWVPQVQVVHPVPAPQFNFVPLPDIKPLKLNPLPTLAPFIFPKQKPFRPPTFPPMKFVEVKAPTFPPMKIAQFPTFPPPRYAFVKMPTVAPMKVLIPPTFPPLQYKMVPWPTLPPMRIPIFPTPEPIRYREIPMPTFAPFRVPIWPTLPAPTPEPLVPKTLTVKKCSCKKTNKTKETSVFGTRIVEAPRLAAREPTPKPVVPNSSAPAGLPEDGDLVGVASHPKNCTESGSTHRRTLLVEADNGSHPLDDDVDLMGYPTTTGLDESPDLEATEVLSEAALSSAGRDELFGSNTNPRDETISFDDEILSSVNDTEDWKVENSVTDATDRNPTPEEVPSGVNDVFSDNVLPTTDRILDIVFPVHRVRTASVQLIHES